MIKFWSSTCNYLRAFETEVLVKSIVNRIRIFVRLFSFCKNNRSVCIHIWFTRGHFYYFCVYIQKLDIQTFRNIDFSPQNPKKNIHSIRIGHSTCVLTRFGVNLSYYNLFKTIFIQSRRDVFCPTFFSVFRLCFFLSSSFYHGLKTALKRAIRPRGDFSFFVIERMRFGVENNLIH